MATGLQRAGALLKEPIKSNKQSNDLVLSGITDQLQESAYKLQVLHMKSWSCVGAGFTKQPSRIDLINNRRKIAVELIWHFGTQKTFWSQQVNAYCTNCIPCQLRKSSPITNKQPLMPRPTVPAPLARVSVDTYGPIQMSKYGNTVVLVVTDFLSRFVWAMPLPDTLRPRHSQKNNAIHHDDDHIFVPVTNCFIASFISMSV